MTNLTPKAAWDLDLVEGYSYVAQWWEQRGIPLLRDASEGSISSKTV